MKKEIIENLSSLIIAAFGFTAALAWNGTVEAVFKRVFGTIEGIGPMLTYAIVVTIVAVVVTIWISKIAEKVKSI